MPHVPGGQLKLRWSCGINSPPGPPGADCHTHCRIFAFIAGVLAAQVCQTLSYPKDNLNYFPDPFFPPGMSLIDFMAREACAPPLHCHSAAQWRRSFVTFSQMDRWPINPSPPVK